MLQYTQDYDEKYPMRQYDNSDIGQAMSWRRTIYPYVKSSQLFSCPSNTANIYETDDSTAARLALLPAGAPAFRRSYGVNAVSIYIGGTAPMEWGSASSLAALPDVARTILVTESKEGAATLPMNYGSNYFDNPNYNFTGHLQTVNFMFADGHVKALKPSATVSPNMWNIEEVDDVPGFPNGNYPALQAHMNEWTSLVNKS